MGVYLGIVIHNWIYSFYLIQKWLSIKETPIKQGSKWMSLSKEIDGLQTMKTIRIFFSNMLGDPTQSSKIWRPLEVLENPIEETIQNSVRLAIKMLSGRSNTIRLKHWRNSDRNMRFWEISPFRINLSNTAIWSDRATHCTIVKREEIVLQSLLLRSQAIKVKDIQNIMYLVMPKS